MVRNLFLYTVNTCVNSCSFEIMEPPRPFALRLSSKLLLGITRVFARQTHYLLGNHLRVKVYVNDQVLHY